MTAAKALLHNVNLHVLCASRVNTPMRPTKVADDAELRPAGRRSTSAHRMRELVGFAADENGDGEGEFLVTEAQARAAFPVDVVVGTPTKLMEMVRGRGWERGAVWGWACGGV
jgi:ATP-dependent RNA helicase MRH4